MQHANADVLQVYETDSAQETSRFRLDTKARIDGSQTCSNLCLKARFIG